MYKQVVKIAELEPGMTVAESVYATTGSGANMLVARKGSELDEHVIDALTRRNVREIPILFTFDPDERDDAVQPAQIQKVEKEAYQKKLDELGPPPETLVPPIKPMVEEQFKDEAVSNIRRLFTDITSDKDTGNMTTAYHNISDLDKVVGEFISVVSSDSTGLVHIHDLKHYDEYTYHHSLSVAMLAISTGKAMGFSHRELFRLGRCAMLHDIGKQLIPLNIINKKGKLTNEEFDIVKEHTTLGAKSLMANGIGDVELWNSVMFHHEKLNGTGYPKQLGANEIPLFSKIIAVADVYDAVTSYRSYRRPMIPSDAYELINSDIGNAFDYDVVSMFFKKLAHYPINAVLEFSDGRLGIVVAHEHALRPVVKIWGSTEVVDLASNKHLNITVAKVLEPKDLPRGFSFY